MSVFATERQFIVTPTRADTSMEFFTEIGLLDPDIRMISSPSKKDLLTSGNMSVVTKSAQNAAELYIE